MRRETFKGDRRKEFTVFSHTEGITECVKLGKNAGKYLCSPYYQNKENFKHPSNDVMSHKLCRCSTMAHFLPMSYYELLVNVAESIIVLNCSVVTKWIPPFWHYKAQQLFFGDWPFDGPTHLQRYRPKSKAGFLRCKQPTARQHQEPRFR